MPDTEQDDFESSRTSLKNNNEILNRLKNAIWTCDAFHFPVDHAIKYINSGLLGYTKKVDKATGQPIPIRISQANYFRYKKTFSERDEIFNDFKAFVDTGYALAVKGFHEELIHLHQLSAQNLLAATDPVDRQKIIDSMVKTVLPTQSAFADILKKMIQSNKLIANESKDSAKEVTASHI